MAGSAVYGLRKGREAYSRICLWRQPFKTLSISAGALAFGFFFPVIFRDSISVIVKIPSPASQLLIIASATCSLVKGETKRILALNPTHTLILLHGCGSNGACFGHVRIFRPSRHRRNLPSWFPTSVHLFQWERSAARLGMKLLGGLIMWCLLWRGWLCGGCSVWSNAENVAWE